MRFLDPSAYTVTEEDLDAQSDVDRIVHALRRLWINEIIDSTSLRRRFQDLEQRFAECSSRIATVEQQTDVVDSV